VCYVQLYSDAPSPQIFDEQHAANDVSSHTVEDQHLPYRLTFGIEERFGLREEAICTLIIVIIGSWRCLIQV